MPPAFDRATIDLLRDAEEVEIETRRAPGAPLHRTIIWIVVASRDSVLIRSVRGEAGRWYREAVAHRDCVIRLGDRSIPVTAVAADPGEVVVCSDPLRVKYAGDPAVRTMLREDTLATTLKLLPR